MLKTYSNYKELARVLGKQYASGGNRKTVCVQGLGFVGVPMAAAIAKAIGNKGEPIFDVIGVDLPTELGQHRVDSINRGELPFESEDIELTAAIRASSRSGNLLAVPDPEVYKIADIVVVDVPLGLKSENGSLCLDWQPFKAAMQTLGENVSRGALIIVETTVPPGTCENIAMPIIAECLIRRGLSADSVFLAHSYERVMPGKNSLSSITNFWRVYSGFTKEAADLCEEFLKSVIDTDEFPLTRLPKPIASETAKILENSYRAANIAFMEEWARFGEQLGIDMFEVVEAIRKRPTHANMMSPGFGVGGYCLTKDPLFASLGAKDLFALDLSFPLSSAAVRINDQMPLRSLELVESLLKGGLRGKRLLLCGVSYRAGVGDTRYSPSQLFVEEAQHRGAIVDVSDPTLDYWSQLGLSVSKEIPEAAGFDAVVFAVAHREYSEINFENWLDSRVSLVFDAANALTHEQRKVCNKMGCEVFLRGCGLQ